MVNNSKHKTGSPTILFKIRQSSPFLWFVFIISILMIGFMFVVVSKPVSIVYNSVYNDSAVMDSDYQTFFTRTKTIWTGSLMVFVIALLLWTILRMTEKSDAYG